MRIIITTSDDFSNLHQYQKTLAGLSATDKMFVFWFKNADNVPINVLKLMASLKCNIEYIETNEGSDIEVAFTLGKMVALYDKAEIKILSANKSLMTLSSLITGVKPKTERKPRVKKEKKEGTDCVPQVSVQENKVANEEKPIEKKPRKPRKPKEAKIESKEDDAFEVAYAKLMDLFERVKTKAFNPADYTNGIVKATQKTLDGEGAFEENIALWCPSSKNKIISTFKECRDELFEIVKRLHDD